MIIQNLPSEIRMRVAATVIGLVCIAFQPMVLQPNPSVLAQDIGATGKVPGSGDPHAITDPDVLADLNPIFLRIGLASIQEDEKSLRACAAELDRRAAANHRNHVAAGLAKLVVFEKLHDREAYAVQFATISGWERSQRFEAESISRRIKYYVADLIADNREDWIAAAISHAGPQLWAGADDLTLEIARRNLLLLDGYPSKSDFMLRILDQSRLLAQDSKYPADLKALWNSGRQDLAKLNLELDADHHQFESLWRDLRNYLEEFGAEGRHATVMLAVAIDALNRARSQRLDFDPSAVPDKEWFARWVTKCKGLSSEKNQRRLSDAWDHCAQFVAQSLPLGMVSADELARDWKLRAAYRHSAQQPKLKEMLEHMQRATSVPLGISAESDPDQLIAAAINCDGPLHQGMRLVADTTEGQWERTASGYKLHSRKKPFGPAPSMRISLITANLIVLALLAGCALFWQKHRTRQSHSP